MTLDIILVILAIICAGGGIIGAVMPVLPGPLLSWVGYLLVWIALPEQVGWMGLVVALVLAVIITILDYYIPIFGAKKFGSTKYGIWGGVVGLLAGVFFFPPLGIIIGPFVGTVAGDLIAGSNIKMALTSGAGSLLGFIVGTAIKLIYSIAIIIVLSWQAGKFIYSLF